MRQKPMAYTPAERSSDVGSSDADSVPLCCRRHHFFPKDPSKLHCRIVEHGIRQEPLQLRVLVLQRLQPLGLRYVHAAELGFPLLDAGVADAVLAAKLRDRRACLVLLQYADDLFVCETVRFISCSSQ